MVVHYKKEKFDIYIGRPSKWGNSFIIGRDGTREEVIEKYTKYLLGNIGLMRDIGELKGKVLGCWCSPKLCHGEVLEKLANAVKICDCCGAFCSDRYWTEIESSIVFLCCECAG
jgi:hypothetical protein